MARITVEDCLENIPNRFALVQLAAKRTKQLLAGAQHVIADPRGNKPIVVSLREVADGKVRFMTEDEMSRAAEERAHRDAQEMAIEATTPKAPVKLAWAEAPAGGDDDDDDDTVAPKGAAAVNGNSEAAKASVDEDLE